MTTKSQQEVTAEIIRLKSQLDAYKKDNVRLNDLEKQLDSTLYNLRIHQEELHSQNEELVHSREKLEALLSKFSVLFEDSPVSYFVLDKHQTILELNQASARLLNTPKQFLLGKLLLPYINRSEIDALNNHYRRVFDGSNATDELELIPHKRKSVPCVLQSQKIIDPILEEPVSLTVIFDISSQKYQEQQIAMLAERNRRILYAVEDGILGTNESGLIVFSNPASEKMLQFTSEELFGQSLVEILKEKDTDHNKTLDIDSAILNTLKDGDVRTVEEQLFRCKNGSRILVEYVVAPTYEEEYISGLVLTFRDISRRKQAEEILRNAHDQLERRVLERTKELRTVNERLRLTSQVFESTSEAIVITDAKNRIIEVNPAFIRITGYTSDEALGKNPGFMKSGRHDRAFYADLWKKVWQEGFWQGEIWDRRKNGEVYPKWLTINTVKDKTDDLIQCIGVFSDISRVKATEEKLEQLAFFDGLTGLPNRTLFKTRLEHEFTAAHRHRKKIALLFLDLDNFKNINDTLGHAAGDNLLTIMAGRIKSCVRDSDTVSRLGGDEFTIILTDIDDASSVSHVVYNIQKSMRKPMKLDGHRIVVGGSIGIAIYPDDGNTSDSLIKNADAAMYHAKESGRNTYAFFTKELNSQAMRRMDLESGLRQSVENKQLILYYQPKVDFISGQSIGMEALVRWDRPGHGIVSPAEFIPVAEESGLIREIGQQVLEIACRQGVELIDAGINTVPISVNLSTRQLQHANIIDDIRKVLVETGFPPQLLEVEITESMMATDVDDAIDKLNAIREMGITISVDDFGTGYSSLSYLKRFPIHTLKIDRSFVQDLPEDGDDAAIVRAIISMAHSLGLDTVAEGVETQEQGQFLSEHHCQNMQGYLFSRPLSFSDIKIFLEKTNGNIDSRALREG
ncbi:MAG: EAL domain-containing protein [Magnetococcales bacterium]|nr:EAL domain-containing protein [Magnetococcales bacterium]